MPVERKLALYDRVRERGALEAQNVWNGSTQGREGAVFPMPGASVVGAAPRDVCLPRAMAASESQ